MKNLTEKESSQVIELLGVLKSIQPRSGITEAQGKHQFLTKAQTLRQAVSVSPKPRHNRWKNIFNLRKERLAMQILTSAIVIFTLLFGGAGGTVYASQFSMPDELLYPVKLWSEDVRLDLSSDVTQQLNLLDEFGERRILELQDAIETGTPPTQAVIDRIQDQTQLNLQLAAGLQEDSLVPTLLKLHERLMKQDQIMQQLNQQDQTNSSLAQTQSQLQNQIRLVEEGLQNPVTFRQRVNNPNENTPDNTPGILDPEKTIPSGNGTETTPGPDNDNSSQNGEQKGQETEEAISEDAGIDQTNGNQTGDGICDEVNCPNPDDCDGDCDNTNCQGTGDCDGSGMTEDASGTQTQYQTGKTEQPGPQAQPTQKSGNTQGSNNK